MKEQYSKLASKALKLAEHTAKRCSHNYVGTEHLLAGLLAVQEGTAGHLLIEAGVSQEKLLELIEKLVAPSSDVLLAEPQGYTPRAKQVLLLKRGGSWAYAEQRNRYGASSSCHVKGV